MKISLIFILFAAFFFSPSEVKAQKKDFVVVLDAGHGGKDPGKVGYKKVKEKDVALKIVLQVGKLLGELKNVKVIYTRKTDVFIELKERGRIANKADADLFVSVHCNAHNTQASGAETWVLGTHANRQNFEVAKAENAVILMEDNYKTNYKGFDPNSPESVIGLTLMQEEYLDQSIQLASIIQSGLTNDLKRKDRGVKQAGFVVLHQTYMPSVLIETGFLTNRREGVYLGTKVGQSKFSESIYKGIVKYKDQLTLNTVVNTRSSSPKVIPKIVKKVIPKKKPKVVAKSKIKTVVKSKSNIKFKVQIAAGGNKLTTKSYNFKGLKGVERLKVGSLYKYYFGSTSEFADIKNYHKQAKSRGYKSSFIVAFKNGVKITVAEALKKS